MEENINPLIVQEFDFMDHKILAVEKDAIWYFSPRHICADIGLTWPTQQKKLKNQADKFNCSLMATVGQDGKRREMLVLPADFIGKTFSVKLTENTVGHPETIISCHGVIRVAMLAKTKKANAFKERTK